jgi:hypothetical protein
MGKRPPLWVTNWGSIKYPYILNRWCKGVRTPYDRLHQSLAVYTRIWTLPRMGYIHTTAAVRRYAQRIYGGILMY